MPIGQEKKGGREKGTQNKETKSQRDSFKLLVDNNLPKMQNDLDKLTPAERIKYIIELAKFCMPTLKAIEMSGEINTTQRQPIIFIEK